MTETVDETLSGIARVDETPFETETINDTPVQIESVDQTSVPTEADDTQFVVETMDEPDIFADQISSSRTASLDPDITEEPAVIETAGASAVWITAGSSVAFASRRFLSRSPSFGPDTTTEYPHKADLSPDTLWDSAVGSQGSVSSLQSLMMMQASDIDDAVLEATKDALRAACEVDSSTIEGASFLDSVLQVTRDILMTTYETESDGTRSVMEESLNYIRGYEILRDVVMEIVNESDTMPADLKQFIARFSELRRLPFWYSSSDQSLFQPARLESDVEPQGSVAVVSINSNHEYV